MDLILDLNYSSYLPQNRDAQILDFGCGQGRIIKFLKSKGYKNISGVDIDDEILQLLEPEIRHYVQHITNVEEYLKKSAHRFDAIILKDVIYYFQRPEVQKILNLLVACLKPGGVIIIEVFNGSLLTANYTANKDIGIVTQLTEYSLAQIMKSSQLQKISIFAQIQSRKLLFSCAHFFWKLVLKFIFIMERGFDQNNPTLFTKSIIGVGYKNP